MSESPLLLQLLQATDKAHRRPRAAEPLAEPALEGASRRGEDLVVCACCQEAFPMLKRHLLVEHGMDEETYRVLYAIPAEEPLVSRSYLARKQACLQAYRDELPAPSRIETLFGRALQI